MAEQTNPYLEVTNVVKGDDLGLFINIRMKLNDIRESRKSGDVTLYNRCVEGLSHDASLFYDTKTEDKIEEIKAKVEKGKMSKWAYSDELYLIIMNMFAAAGFIPIREADGIIEDDDIDVKVQQPDS